MLGLAWLLYPAPTCRRLSKENKLGCQSLVTCASKFRTLAKVAKQSTVYTCQVKKKSAGHPCQPVSSKHASMASGIKDRTPYVSKSGT